MKIMCVLGVVWAAWAAHVMINAGYGLNAVLLAGIGLCCVALLGGVKKLGY